MDEPAASPDLAPQRKRSLELDPDLRPHLGALAFVQHHAQDALDAEPGVPEAGVVHCHRKRAVIFPQSGSTRNVTSRVAIPSAVSQHLTTTASGLPPKFSVCLP